MYKLRKRLSYDDMIKSINNPPVFKYKEQKGIKILNNIIISNLLFNDNIIDEKLYEDNIIKLNKFTQTPHTKTTQTDILNQETQKPYELQHYDLHPHLYYKIDAFSKYMENDKDIPIKNDSTSKNILTSSEKIQDNMNQTSKYIPNSLKDKSDNINQTVRYMLKNIEPEKESEGGDYQEWYDSLNKKPPEDQEPEDQEPDNTPGFFNWLIGLTVAEPPPSDPPSLEPPSVPSVSIQSPSEQPPTSSNPSIPPYPPSSPSPVMYPASVSSDEEERRSRKSSSSNKMK